MFFCIIMNTYQCKIKTNTRQDDIYNPLNNFNGLRNGFWFLHVEDEDENENEDEIEMEKSDSVMNQFFMVF